MIVMVFMMFVMFMIVQVIVLGAGGQGWSGRCALEDGSPGEGRWVFCKVICLPRVIIVRTWIDFW